MDYQTVIRRAAPTRVRIDYGFSPPPPPNPVTARVEERVAVCEVFFALNALAYAGAT